VTQDQDWTDQPEEPRSAAGGEQPAGGAEPGDARVATVREPAGSTEDAVASVGGAEDALVPDSLGAPTLEAACEAVLLLADQPLDLVSLATIVRRPVEQVEAVVRGLSAQYTEDGRGFDLREVAGGWRFYTRADCAEAVSRYVVDGQQARLTQAALETLAIIAYRQPISRSRISAVRGVNVDGVVRTLLTRGLITEAGTDPGSQATLLATPPYFLERLGASSLAELPPLADHVPTYDALGDLVDQA
jgi:segregation and condensation protein B